MNPLWTPIKYVTKDYIQNMQKPEPKENKELTLKRGDRVKVLKKDVDKDIWREQYHGAIIEVGTHDFVKCFDPQKHDSNCATLSESSQWVNSDSKMTRVLKA